MFIKLCLLFILFNIFSCNENTNISVLVDKKIEKEPKLDKEQKENNTKQDKKENDKNDKEIEWEKEQKDYVAAYRKILRDNPNTYIRAFWHYPYKADDGEYDINFLSFKRSDYDLLFSAVGDCAARSVVLLLLFYAFQSDNQFDYFINKLKEIKQNHSSLVFKKWDVFLTLLSKLKNASPKARRELINDWDNDWLLLVNMRLLLSTLLTDPIKQKGMSTMGQDGKVVIGSILKAISNQWPGLNGTYLHVTQTNEKPYSVVKWSFFNNDMQLFFANDPIKDSNLDDIKVKAPDIVILSDEAHTNILILPKYLSLNNGAFLSF